ncbi:MAG: phosphoglycerate kinase [Robiginitomaculum sp.]|nr:MAG: phosphoglycerate kinase [Robiginitomaculum sp.]
MAFRTLDDADVKGQRVLVRVDFNVPMQGGRISDDTRLRAALPTINDLRGRGAKVILLSHFGRPKGERIANMSLAPVAPVLADLLGASVGFAADCVGDAAQAAVAAMAPGDVLLLENTRFHSGETTNDPTLARAMADLGDLFVLDAFSSAHRAHASTVGIAQYLPAFAGRAMQRELEHLEKALGKPQHPVLAVVGGAKVSSKIDLLQNLVARVDILCIGGGMANTFLHALGKPVGASLCEKDLADTAGTIMTSAVRNDCEILLPVDVVVAQEFVANAAHQTVGLDHVGEKDMILDAGPASVAALNAAMDRAKTVIWNGPLGAFELPPFDAATRAAARHCAQLTRAGKLVSVAGGGDTVSALNQAGVSNDFTFISTAGGAFLEWMEGKALPGVEALKSD